MFEAGVEIERIVSTFNAFFNSTNANGVVLGVSGGIDSAVCLKLLVKSIAPQKITVLLLPEKKNSELNELVSFVESCGVNYYLVELNPFLESFVFPWRESKLARMNLKARLRMLLLYNYANSNNFLVCGTGNKSELSLGYFTKFGDGAVDFLLIGKYWKTQVFDLARALVVPEKIISKKPSADLFEGQSDGEELGASYNVIDKILVELLEKNKSVEEVVRLGFDKKLVESLFNRVKKNKHKTSMIRII